VRTIWLAKGKGEAWVDDEDFGLVNNYSWCLYKANGRSYARAPVNGTTLLLHRLIFHPAKGQNLKCLSDNYLNCCRDNWKICTPVKRMYTKSNGCTSTFKGVTWYKPTKKWMAYGVVNEQQKNLGYYLTEQEAACAYNAWAIETYGFHLAKSMLNEPNL